MSKKDKKKVPPVDKAKDFKGTMKKLMGYLAKYKIKLFLIVIFSIGGTIFSIIGPRLLGKATTTLFNGLINKVNGTGSIDFDKIIYVLSLALGLYILSSLLTSIQGLFMAKISNQLTYSLRSRISSKINRIPMKYFESQPYGDVLSRVTNDVDTLQLNLNQSITQFITSVTTVIGVLIMMFSINLWLTVSALLILPISLIIIVFIMKHSQKYFDDQQKYLGVANSQVEEIFGGLDVVISFNQEDEVLQNFEEANGKLYISGWKSQFFSGMMMPIMTFVGNLGYVMVAILGGFLTIKGSIEIGDIQSFFQYIRSFTQPISQVAQISSMLQTTASSAERIFEFLEEVEEEQKVIDNIESDRISGNIDFNHVAFGYDTGSIIVYDFSANIAKGQKIAIVGPTGAGKSTMIKLLMRFYDVNSGSIKIDNYDIREFSRNNLREQIGMVLQDTWLFNGSIMENIRYGRLDATDQEVIEVSKMAKAHKFIMEQSNGYDTIMNEESSNISQGQKQLLTIARALLAKRKIMVLDEATSSVDTRTEINIQEAMDQLMIGKTTFVIAHRLSTIRDADIILVMKDGDIIEQGNHEELLAKHGFYEQLYNSQFEKVSAI